jgi:hypothetical protein
MAEGSWSERANNGSVEVVIDQCLFIRSRHTACIIMAVLGMACDKLMNLIKLKLVLLCIYVHENGFY